MCQLPLNQQNSKPIRAQSKRRQTTKSAGKRGRPSGNWFRLCIWLVERVVRVSWTNHRAKWSKTNALPDYFWNLLENFSIVVWRFYADFDQLITFPKWSKISRHISFWFRRMYLWRSRTTSNFRFFFRIRITLSWSIKDPESFGPKTQAQN